MFLETIRGSAFLIAKSFGLLLRALPLNMAMMLLNILALWVGLEFTGAYLLPVNRPLEMDLPLAAFLWSLALSHWLASATYVFSQTERERAPSILKATWFGLCRLPRAWVIATTCLLLIYLPLLVLEKIAVVEAAIIGGLLLGVVFWCVTLVSFPILASSFILKESHPSAPGGLRGELPGRAAFLLAAVVMMGLGCIPGHAIIACFWRESEIPVSLLLLPTVLSFPLSSQIVYLGQIRGAGLSLAREDS